MKFIFCLIILLNFNYINAQKADFDLKAKLSKLKMQTVELHNEILKNNMKVKANLDIFENEELNLIMSAKNFMEKEDLESSLKMIMKIKNYENFYLKWVEQSQLYIEFKNEIKKVI